MGQAKFGKALAGGTGIKSGVSQAKGSSGVKMSPILGGMGRGIFRGAAAGGQDGSKGFAGEQQGKRRIGRGGLFGGAAMRMAGSVGQKKEECD